MYYPSCWKSYKGTLTNMRHSKCLGVSSSYYLWSALLCIWLNVCGFPFMLFMLFFEWAQLWVMGLDNTNMNTHKYAQTHTHTDKTQSEVTQVRWEEKKSIPVKRFELIDWENKFATCSYLFISPLEKQSGGYWECWASFPDTDSLTPIVSNEDFQVISWSESGPIRV